MLSINIKMGRKSLSDFVVCLDCDKCGSSHLLKYRQIANYLLLLMKVEENLFDSEKGKLGKKMFRNYILDTILLEKVPDDKDYSL